jgi:hypothetical protein
MFSLEELNFRQRLLEKLDKNKLKFDKLAIPVDFQLKVHEKIKRSPDQRKTLNLIGNRL